MPKVMHYKVSYEFAKVGEPKISILLQDENGAQHTLSNMSMDESAYVLELLRFESPLNYEPKTQTLTLTTWQEPGGAG